MIFFFNLGGRWEVHSEIAHVFGNNKYSSIGLSMTKVLVDCNSAWPASGAAGEGLPSSTLEGLLDSGYSGSKASPAIDACSYSLVYIVAYKIKFTVRTL